MPAIEVRISGGIFLLSLTYWSNCCVTARRSASTSLFASVSGGTGVTSETKYSPLSTDAVRGRALHALDEHLHRAVGELQHLQDRRDAADLEHVVGLGLVLAGGLLGDQHDLPARFHRDLERLDRFRAADEQRNDHVREDDDVAQRQQRQLDLLGGQNGMTGHLGPLFLRPM